MQPRLDSATSAQHESSDVPLCQLTGVTKKFGGTVACRDVDFDVKSGEVHALVGENGAGKSTLMKILHGLYQPDAGEIRINGVPVRLESARDAEQRGIAMIPQELDLFPDLSIAENLCIGRPRSRLWWGGFDWHSLNESAVEVGKRLGVSFEVAGEVRALSAANAQLVAISRALFWNSNVVIMDEPTAALTDQEAERLFKVVAELKGRGVGIVYVSHRLEEIFALGDRVTVLRDGQRVHTGPTSQLNSRDLIRLMVGRPFEQLFTHTPHEPAEIALEVKNATRTREFTEVTLSVRAGEIVGLGGLIGAGRSELAQAVCGICRLTAGEVYVSNKKATLRSAKDGIRAGIAYLPEERKSQGLFSSLSVKANITYSILDQLSHFGFIDDRQENQAAARFRSLFKIRSQSLNIPVYKLSGGNQQKIVLSKILALEPKIIILDEPTRGVDVGAKSEIYRIIDDLAKEGRAVLLISSEMNELLAMSDRILVMHEGKLTGEFSREECSAEKVMAAAAGVIVDQENQEINWGRSVHQQRRTRNEITTYLQRPLRFAESLPLVFLVLLVAALSMTTPGFATAGNLRSIVDQVAVVGTVALAVNMVILAGEIDVSVGSLLAVCAFIYGDAATIFGGSLAPLGASLIAGGLLGVTNGLLVTVARVPSIIATLGTMLIWRGAVLLFGADHVVNLAVASRFWGLGGFAGLSVAALIFVLMFALFWLLAYHSTWGREVFAVGGNREAARLAGLPILRVKCWCFLLSGLTCGLASAVYIGQIGELQATAATGFELRVIAAVVLGGSSIAGGRGSTLAPIVGALLVGVILNGLTLNRIPGSWEQLVTGFLILLAITVSSMRARLLRQI